MVWVVVDGVREGGGRRPCLGLDLSLFGHRLELVMAVWWWHREPISALGVVERGGWFGDELGSISDNHEKFAVGTKVQVVYNEDGEWYDVTIEAAEETKKAIRQKIEQAAAVDFQSQTLPTKLRINLEDPEDVFLVVTGLVVA
ncbi:hypothetical protein Ddye_017171 [Dipteronia dyeriana]|uniref:Tudor domain-containing protein n=1 Tax=Dipteronia dyeriana TaxID=168575 RepID=A0AAD9X0Y2_9ROSI|nr:hypothetical protein Ddye_017171 [Dipteronia dyeriana]